MEIIDVSSSDTEDYLSMSEEEEYYHDNAGNIRSEKEVEEVAKEDKRRNEEKTAEEHKNRRILPSSFLPLIQKEREKNKNNVFLNGSDISLMGFVQKQSLSHGSREKEEVTQEKEKMGNEEKTAEEHNNRRILPSSFRPLIQKEREENKNKMFHNGSDVSLRAHVQKQFLPPVRSKTSTTIEDSATNDEDIQILHYHEKSNDLGMNGHGFYDHNHMEHRRHLPSWMSGGSIVNLPAVTSSSSSLPYPKAIDQDERLIFQAALQDLNQPKYEGNVPSDLLTVSLLRHQKIALAWMLKKENSSFCSGGILADDQGLGKTVSIISLIQTERSKQDKFKSGVSDSIKPEAFNLDEADNSNPNSEAEPQMPETQEGKASSSSTKKRHSGGTLVVCPASILRQWAHEIQEKIPEDKRLSYLIYHGSLRSRDPSFLAKHDVVLTTYSIVTNEVTKHNDDNDTDHKTVKDYALAASFAVPKKEKKAKEGKGKRKRDSGTDRSGPLARVRWFRVVLDEAQTIKNFRTQVSKACCGLRAKRRWCLSGTPLQNSVDDLYSYFRFLRYDPYADYGSFCSSIKNPISNHPTSGFKKLQAILRTVMLRRTKGTFIDGEPIIKLPPRVINLKKIYFTPEEREFYSSLEADSRKKFKAYADAGTLNQNYASILLLLLRLRQACDHPLLVKEHHASHAARSSLMMARKLPREMLVTLLKLLEGSLAICGMCSDLPEEPVVTMCGHVFCYQCISGFLNGEVNSCPASMCKDVLAPDSVFSRSTLERCLAGEFVETPSFSGETSSLSLERDFQSSSKIEAAMEILRSMCGNETSGKAIVFSQWTSMLDFLELSLNHSLIQYRRLDGSMSLVAREKAVRDFNTDAEVMVMIMSLKAGNLGLNMVAACHVILLDPWWNPTTEDQAIDRAHRIGQLRTVTVSRLTVSDTVEDRILALQEKKREMVSSAFGEDQTVGRGTRLTVEDLQYLFRV